MTKTFICTDCKGHFATTKEDTQGLRCGYCNPSPELVKRLGGRPQRPELPKPGTTSIGMAGEIIRW